MKKFAVIRKDRTIKVYTPIPYIVTAYKNSSQKELDEVQYHLENSVKFLYDCMKVLGITKKCAIEKQYTLNLYTGSEFRHLILENNTISHELKKIIIQYDW